MHRHNRQIILTLKYNKTFEKEERRGEKWKGREEEGRKDGGEREREENTKSNEFKLCVTAAFQSGNLKGYIVLKIYPQCSCASVFAFLCHVLPLLYSMSKSTWLK